MSNNYWFVVTGWNDDQGQQKRQIEHWIDASAFSVEEVLKATDREKAGILQPILTLDIEGKLAYRETPASEFGLS
jgi:hypothetical protein